MPFRPPGILTEYFREVAFCLRTNAHKWFLKACPQFLSHPTEQSLPCGFMWVLLFLTHVSSQCCCVRMVVGPSTAVWGAVWDVASEISPQQASIANTYDPALQLRQGACPSLPSLLGLSGLPYHSPCACSSHSHCVVFGKHHFAVVIHCLWLLKSFHCVLWWPKPLGMGRRKRWYRWYRCCEDNFFFLLMLGCSSNVFSAWCWNPSGSKRYHSLHTYLVPTSAGQCLPHPTPNTYHPDNTYTLSLIFIILQK